MSWDRLVVVDGTTLWADAREPAGRVPHGRLLPRVVSLTTIMTYRAARINQLDKMTP